MFPKGFKDEEEQSVAAAFAAVAILDMQNTRLLSMNQRKNHKPVSLLGALHVAHATKALQHHGTAVRAEM
eukprot:2580007-Pleurochrysis_carterae.AAC.1